MDPTLYFKFKDKINVFFNSEFKYVIYYIGFGILYALGSCLLISYTENQPVVVESKPNSGPSNQNINIIGDNNKINIYNQTIKEST